MKLMHNPLDPSVLLNGCYIFLFYFIFINFLDSFCIITHAIKCNIHVLHCSESSNLIIFCIHADHT